jgi:hypothetical protein
MGTENKLRVRIPARTRDCFIQRPDRFRDLLSFLANKYRGSFPPG